jgi:hypothetical protein
MRSVKSVLLLALVVGGCSSDAVSPVLIAGKWTQDFTIPGNFLEMTLTPAGSMISGTGDWCGEAGPCGILAVTGTTTGLEVHIDLVFTATSPNGTFPSFEDHFDGRLISPSSLQGTITAVVPGQPPGTGFPTGFHRG